MWALASSKSVTDDVGFTVGPDACACAVLPAAPRVTPVRLFPLIAVAVTVSSSDMPALIVTVNRPFVLTPDHDDRPPDATGIVVAESDSDPFSVVGAAPPL